MQNHQSRPTGSAPLHEVNAALTQFHEAYATSPHGDRRRGRGCGRGTRNGQDQNNNSNRLGPRNTQASHNHQKWNKQDKANGSQPSADRVIEEACHRCGTNGHWARVETYWMDADPIELEPVDATHLDVSDFFVDTDGKSFDPMIGGGMLPN
ncbi:unnamed protein product [Prunus armeniaca]